MGGIITPSKEEEMLKILRLDDPKKLKDFLTENQLAPDTLYTKKKRTLIQLCCFYESPKCLSKLIEMDYDYNQVENATGNSPLFIACKFNSLNIVELLLSKSDCKKLVKNFENLNEFDIAFLKGNYSICYYLLYEYKSNSKSKKNDDDENEVDNDNNIENDHDIINTEMNINTKSIEQNRNYDINQTYQKYFYNTNFDLDHFLSLQEAQLYPLFNMQLFFKYLCKKTPPNECEGAFAPERKMTKDLLNKVPDPNETWGHFFKRLVNLELYNPPLVDKKKVTQMNSLYMSTQMKLLENEYGVKLSYYKPDSDENNNNNNIEEEEESPIVNITKKKKGKKNIENNEKDDNKEDDKEGEKEDDNNGKENIEDKSENLSVLRIQSQGYASKINKRKK